MKGKVLALDYGTKHVGVASGNFELGIAFPRDVIDNKGQDSLVLEILKLVGDLEVLKIVVGLPLSEGEDENPIMAEVRSFVEKLKASGLDVEFIDERYSSFEAANKFGRAKKDDAQAAQVILQRYFDKNVS